MYVEIMAGILEDVHKKLDFVDMNAYFISTGIYPNGIPKDFYKALAWQGLDGTMAWNIMESIQVSPPLKSQIQRIEDFMEIAKVGRKSCE